MADNSRSEPYALFINSVNVTVANDIVAVQRELPEQILFLQPHDKRSYARLRSNPPTVDKPLMLYASVGGDFATVACTAEVVGWEYKPSLPYERRNLMVRLQAIFQPTEIDDYYNYLKDCPNLLYVRRMRMLESRERFSVAELIKIKDGKPLSTNRQSPGGISYVRPR